MTSSSDEDVPLAARPALLQSKPAKVNRVVASDDDDSPMPSWLKDVKLPAGGVLAGLSESSDSDVKEVLSPPALKVRQEQQQQQQQQEAQPGHSQRSQQLGTQQQRQEQQPRSTGKRGGGGRGRRGPASALPAPAADAARVAAAAAAGLEEEPATQPSSVQKKGGGVAAAARGALHAAAAKEMPVLLPEKLGQTKLLVELEAQGEAHGVTDLSGDSGAIGRLLMTGPASEPQMQLDLKGGLQGRMGVCLAGVGGGLAGPAEARQRPADAAGPLLFKVGWQAGQ